MPCSANPRRRATCDAIPSDPPQSPPLPPPPLPPDSQQVTHWLSYETSPRAKIFRRDQANVHSVRSMAGLMRSNNWQHDPVSWGRL